jgi:hypothetical protein
MLITRAEVLAWAPGPLTDVDTAVVDRCITAAGDAIVRETERIWEKTANAVTTYFDGDRAMGRYGEILFLPRAHRPVVHSGPDLVTVSENGTSLVVGTSTPSSAHVIVDGAGEDRRCRLIRVGGAPAGASWNPGVAQGWAPGVRNIAVSYKAGFEDGQIPQDIREVCAEWAWLMFTESRRLGVGSVGGGGTWSLHTHDLSDYAKRILKHRKAA